MGDNAAAGKRAVWSAGAFGGRMDHCRSVSRAARVCSLPGMTGGIALDNHRNRSPGNIREWGEYLISESFPIQAESVLDECRVQQSGRKGRSPVFYSKYY